MASSPPHPPAAALAAPLDPATEALLDAAIEHRRGMAHAALVDYAVATGRYLIQTFFDGNLAAFFDRRSEPLSVVGKGHKHNEAAWKERAGVALRFLLPGAGL